MSEQETHDTIQQQPDSELAEQSTQEEPEQSSSQPELLSKSKEEVSAENWRKIRERNKELERQNKEINERLAQREQQAQKKELDPDDIPSWRDVNEALTELKLKSEFPDFNKVVNHENLRKLKEQDPDLAMMIYNNPDLYKQSAVAYRAIKKMGIFDSQSERDKEVINNNRTKPRTITSMSPQEGASGPLSHANIFSQGLTSDLKAQLWKQTNEARKKV